MTLSKAIHLYGKILSRAWDSIIAQKEWWPIAAVAGLVYTGGIFELLMRSLMYIGPADTLGITQVRQLSPFFAWLYDYAQNLALLDVPNVATHIFIALFIGIIIAIIAILAQYILLVVTSKGTKNISFKTIKRSFHHLHFWRILGINLSMRVALIIVICAMILSLSYLESDSLALMVLSKIGVFAIGLPILFFIEAFCMTSLIQLPNKDTTIIKIAHRTLILLNNHWVSAIEISILLFFINFIATGILIFVMMILSIVFGLMFELALTIGSIIIMSLVTFISLLIMGALFYLFAGMVTSFNYSAWFHMYEHLNRFPHFPALEHFIRKLVQ